MFQAGHPKQNYRIYFAVGLLALMVAMMSSYFLYRLVNINLKNNKQPEVTYVKPLPGHWLKTSPEEGPGSVDETAGQVRREIAGKGESGIPMEAGGSEALRDGETETVRGGRTFNGHMNRQVDSTNVMYVWTDKGKLKIVSVMTLNKTTEKPAIVVIPIITEVNKKGQTVKEVFAAKGREALRKDLEARLEAPLHNYVHVDNKALYALSDILGPLKLNSEEVTMAQALEESAAGLRKNDKTIVREVARKAIQPATLMQLPKLIKVFTEHINSDFSVAEMLQILNFTRQLKVDTTEKAVLQGRDVYKRGRYCKVVDEVMWNNILYEVVR